MDSDDDGSVLVRQATIFQFFDVEGASRSICFGLSSVRDLISTHRNLFITPDYSQDPTQICSHCAEYLPVAANHFLWFSQGGGESADGLRLLRQVDPA